MNPTPTSLFSRRHFLGTAGLATASLWLGSNRLGAEEAGVVQTMRQGGATDVVKAFPVRNKITALIGSGGNVGVLSGVDGKVLIDAGLAGSQPQITEALGKLGGEPVKHLINTHWHFDHTDGNEWLHKSGATIHAQENTLKRMSTNTRVEAWNFTFPPASAGALPTEIIGKSQVLKLNGETLEIEYHPGAHTDTDLTVYYRESDVFQTGDIFWNGHYPFIDYSTGGSVNVMIQAVENILKKIGDKTAVIPGHGPVGDKASLTEYHQVMSAIRDKVASLKKAGKSLDEIIAAKPTAAYDSKWGGFVINGSLFTKLVYAGV
jgi:glyoxylase-like metal-dependent hydrolase (beta-lactamase superfamily II)